MTQVVTDAESDPATLGRAARPLRREVERERTHVPGRTTWSGEVAVGRERPGVRRDRGAMDARSEPTAGTPAPSGQYALPHVPVRRSWKRAGQASVILLVPQSLQARQRHVVAGAG